MFKTTRKLKKELQLLKDELQMIDEIDQLRDNCAGLTAFYREIFTLLHRWIKCDAVFVVMERLGKFELEAVDQSGAVSETAVTAAGNCIIQNGYWQQQLDQQILCAAPLLSGENPVGAIALLISDTEQSDEHVSKMLQTAASHVDSSIEQISSREAARKQISELEVINRIDELRDQSPSVNVMMGEVLPLLAGYIPAMYWAGLIINQKNNKPEVVAVHSAGDFLKEISNSDVIALAKESMTTCNDTFPNSTVLDNCFVMPIVFGEDLVFGAIVVGDRAGGVSRQEQALLHIAEDQLDSAVQHYRVFNDLLIKKKELEVLYKIDQIRDTTKDFDMMLQAVLKEFVSVTDANNGFIVLYNDDVQIKDIKYQGNDFEKLRPLISEVSQLAIEGGKLIDRQDVDQQTLSMMCIPLILSDKVVGTFGVINPRSKRYFDIADEKLLIAVASQADTAIFEDLSKQRIKKVFSRYVNEKVIDKLLLEDADQLLKGQRKHMSVSFADIRGFTSMSEQLKDPEELVEIINRYLEVMTDVVLEHDGTLDKFVGDEVMSLFGTPVDNPKHAVQAIETAIGMQRAMARLRHEWAAQQRPECHIGIGINTGEMVAGNIGSEKMADYTVLGDAVNLGARLCGAAAADQILVSEFTWREARDSFEFRELEAISVKGKAEPVKIFEVVY